MKRIVSFSALLIAAAIGTGAMANLSQPESDGSDFVLTFTVAELYGSNKSSQGNFTPGPGQYFGNHQEKTIENVFDSGVDIYANTHADRTTADFGFIGPSSNDLVTDKFMVTGYRSELKFVTGIEIEWATEQESGGWLRLFGSNGEENPYTTRQHEPELAGLSNDVDLILEPTVTSYSLDNPVSYISLVYHDNNSSLLSRVKSFSLRFSDQYDVNLAVDKIGQNDSSPTEYYDLNGLRINPDNMGKGIYIRKEASKTSKVMVK